MSKETSPTAANGNGDSGGRNMEKTKVLYVQNLPDEFREDLSNLCTNFGPVKEMMPLPEKRSCFVEFETLEHAVACHDFYTKETVVLGARPIKFSYSSRQEITLKPNADNNPPGNILLITVNNVQYPVTVDVLYQVFCRVGTLEKVIIFERGSYIQAFVQLEDVRQAIKAKEQFEIMFINDALEENEYDLRKTAEDLNIHYSNLHRRMRLLGMSICSYIIRYL